MVVSRGRGTLSCSATGEAWRQGFSVSVAGEEVGHRVDGGGKRVEKDQRGGQEKGVETDERHRGKGGRNRKGCKEGRMEGGRKVEKGIEEMEGET